MGLVELDSSFANDSVTSVIQRLQILSSCDSSIDNIFYTNNETKSSFDSAAAVRPTSIPLSTSSSTFQSPGGSSSSPEPRFLSAPARLVTTNGSDQPRRAHHPMPLRRTESVQNPSSPHQQLRQQASLSTPKPRKMSVDVLTWSDQQQQQVDDQTTSQQQRYKTELCRTFEENGNCPYGSKCQFAHGRAELRTVSRHPKYKTEMCRTFHTTGYCPYGPRCHFIHNADEAAASSSSTSRTGGLVRHASLNDDHNNSSTTSAAACRRLASMWSQCPPDNGDGHDGWQSPTSSDTSSFDSGIHLLDSPTSSAATPTTIVGAGRPLLSAALSLPPPPPPPSTASSLADLISAIGLSQQRHQVLGRRGSSSATGWVDEKSAKAVLLDVLIARQQQQQQMMPEATENAVAGGGVGQRHYKRSMSSTVDVLRGHPALMTSFPVNSEDILGRPAGVCW